MGVAVSALLFWVTYPTMSGFWNLPGGRLALPQTLYASYTTAYLGSVSYTHLTAQTKEDTAQAILNVLAESKLGSMPSTQLRAEVMKEMGCSEKTYNRAYSELAKSGEIKKQQFNQKNGTRGWFTFLGYCSKTNDQVTI